MTKVSIALGIGLGIYAQAQWIHQPTPGIPRTADGKPNLSATVLKTAEGKPDLSGIWLLNPSGGISQLKPSEIKPWAVALHKQRDEDLGKDSGSTQCLPFGFIESTGLVKIVQTPQLIVMLSEDLEYRQIFVDGRELPKDPNPAWMGYSVGHWEGDTLVVESTGYNERTWLDMGYPHTENLHITERFHRSDFGHLVIDATFSDPAIYDKPWTGKISGLYTGDTELLEYVCAENEKDRVHLVGKKSDDKEVKLAPEILSKYVGTYEFRSKDFGVPGPEFLPINITLEEETLKLSFAGGSKESITPLSETTFTGVGGRAEFLKDDKGEVTAMVISIAEGDFRGNRKK